jgi:hypothetical protein
VPTAGRAADGGWERACHEPSFRDVVAVDLQADGQAVVQVGGVWRLTAQPLGEVAQPRPSLGARQVEPARLLGELLDRCHLPSCNAYSGSAPRSHSGHPAKLTGSCIRVAQNAPSKQSSPPLPLVNATGKQTPEDPSSPSTSWCKSVDVDAASDGRSA